MSLRLRPHTVTVEQPTTPTDNAGRKGALVFGAPSTVRGKVEPMTPQTAFAMFQVDTSQPRRLMVNPADGPAFARVNTRVVWKGQRLRVVSWREFDAGLIPHWSILLDTEPGA